MIKHPFNVRYTMLYSSYNILYALHISHTKHTAYTEHTTLYTPEPEPKHWKSNQIIKMNIHITIILYKYT